MRVLPTDGNERLLLIEELAISPQVKDGKSMAWTLDYLRMRRLCWPINAIKYPKLDLWLFIIFTTVYYQKDISGYTKNQIRKLKFSVSLELQK